MTDNAAAYKALAKAQAAMPKVIKNTENNHFKNRYADLASVIEACRKPFTDNGFAILQPLGQDETGRFVDTILAHESGAVLSSRIYLPPVNDMQKLGSAITYARRYELLGMAALAPEDDDGNDARSEATHSATKAPHAPPPELRPEGNTERAQQAADKIVAGIRDAESDMAAFEFFQQQKAGPLLPRLRDSYPDLYQQCIAALDARMPHPTNQDDAA
jgi:hypothetical protein